MIQPSAAARSKVRARVLFLRRRLCAAPSGTVLVAEDKNDADEHSQAQKCHCPEPTDRCAKNVSWWSWCPMSHALSQRPQKIAGRLIEQQRPVRAVSRAGLMAGGQALLPACPSSKNAYHVEVSDTATISRIWDQGYR